ncbi:hypothetical protein ABID25_006700 [Mesorhizobium abyssinicae]
MKDRLDDVLQSRSLSDNLIAPCHLSTQSLRRLIRNPDFRQEAAGTELRQNAGIDRIRLDLGIGDDAHLLGVCDHHFLHMRRDNRGGRGCVTRRLDHHDIIQRQLSCEGIQQIAPHVDTTQPPEPAVLPSYRLGEGAMDIQPDDAHARSSFLARSKTGAGGQHDIY